MKKFQAIKKINNNKIICNNKEQEFKIHPKSKKKIFFFFKNCKAKLIIIND